MSIYLSFFAQEMSEQGGLTAIALVMTCVSLAISVLACTFLIGHRVSST